MDKRRQKDSSFPYLNLTNCTFWEENLCWSKKGAFSLRKFFNLGNKANHELWWIGKKFEKLVHWELVPLLINWSKAFSQIRLLHLLKRSSFTLILSNYQDLSRFPSFYILSLWTGKSYVRINQNEVICDMAVCCTLLGCKWGELWPNPQCDQFLSSIKKVWPSLLEFLAVTNRFIFAISLLFKYLFARLGRVFGGT